MQDTNNVTLIVCIPSWGEGLGDTLRHLTKLLCIYKNAHFWTNYKIYLITVKPSEAYPLRLH